MKLWQLPASPPLLAVFGRRIPPGIRSATASKTLLLNCRLDQSEDIKPDSLLFTYAEVI